MRLVKKFHFDAAHFLPNYVGKCKQMHGHTYYLEVSILGNVNPDAGMIMDFCELERIVKIKVLDYLDHKTLNDVIKNPTAENTIIWIKDKLSPHLGKKFLLKLWESPDSYVEF
jgi:6-pyruvoyltetrahydropterin/6-carboxytetrahydropterin synthase